MATVGAEIRLARLLSERDTLRQQLRSERIRSGQLRTALKKALAGSRAALKARPQPEHRPPS